MMMYACNAKTSADTAKSLRHFKGPTDTIDYIYSDGSGEIAEAALLLGIDHDDSVPGRPESNALCERRMRTVTEGAATLLATSGVPRKYWPWAVECFCHLLNIEQIQEAPSA